MTTTVREAEDILLRSYLSEELSRHPSGSCELYIDARALRAETKVIFDRAWQVVGRSVDLPHPGTWITTELGNTPIVIVRDGDHLRGFVNACRHRLHPVAIGSGEGTVLRCGFHGWTYGLDGTLCHVPREPVAPILDRGSLTLASVTVSESSGWIFAHPQPDATHDIRHEVEFGRLMSELELDREVTLWPRSAVWNTVIEGNWKLLVENFLECYHCPTTHSASFGHVYDVRARFKWQVFDGLATHRLRVARPPDGNTDRDYPDFRVLFSWPNTFISADAFAADLTRILPTGPGRSRVLVETFGRPDVNATPDEWSSLFERTFDEDRQVIERQQLGFSSGRIEAPVFLESQEGASVMFRRRVFEQLRQWSTS